MHKDVVGLLCLKTCTVAQYCAALCCCGIGGVLDGTHAGARGTSCVANPLPSLAQKGTLEKNSTGVEPVRVRDCHSRVGSLLSALPAVSMRLAKSSVTRERDGRSVTAVHSAAVGNLSKLRVICTKPWPRPCHTSHEHTINKTHTSTCTP